MSVDGHSGLSQSYPGRSWTTANERRAEERGRIARRPLLTQYGHQLVGQPTPDLSGADSRLHLQSGH